MITLDGYSKSVVEGQPFEKPITVRLTRDGEGV